MARSTKPRICKDCTRAGVTRKRPAPYPGPRCKTHHLEVKAVRSAARKTKHIGDNFGITEEEYQEIYEAQGGHCYLCPATGTGKYRLAVDHDHELAKLHDHPVKKGCRLCIRGLLCRTCNRYVLGHLKDSEEALLRAVQYLRDPPARRILLRPVS